MLRVGADNYQNVLNLQYAKEMDFTGRPLKGLIYVEPAGVETVESLNGWLSYAIDFVVMLAVKWSEPKISAVIRPGEARPGSA